MKFYENLFFLLNLGNEPYNQGCPCFSIVSSGCMKDFARATREPFMNVHLCGTDTATECKLSNQS